MNVVRLTPSQARAIAREATVSKHAVVVEQRTDRSRYIFLRRDNREYRRYISKRGRTNG
jgi:hypothetical protein